MHRHRYYIVWIILHFISCTESKYNVCGLLLKISNFSSVIKHVCIPLTIVYTMNINRFSSNCLVLIFDINISKESKKFNIFSFFFLISKYNYYYAFFKLWFINIVNWKLIDRAVLEVVSFLVFEFIYILKMDNLTIFVILKI